MVPNPLEPRAGLGRPRTGPGMESRPRGGRGPMRPRWAYRRAAMLSVLSVAIPTAVHPVIAPVVAHESGIWGGGFINALAKDPALGSSRFVIGGDTSGLH